MGKLFLHPALICNSSTLLEKQHRQMVAKRTVLYRHHQTQLHPGDALYNFTLVLLPTKLLSADALLDAHFIGVHHFF